LASWQQQEEGFIKALFDFLAAVGGRLYQGFI